jgi:hypothetical protein
MGLGKVHSTWYSNQHRHVQRVGVLPGSSRMPGLGPPIGRQNMP